MIASLLAPALLLQSFERVQGTVSYRERIALPATAMLFVTLDRYEGQNRTTVAETRNMIRGRQVPLDFSIGYYRTPNDSKARFAINVAIKEGDKTLFETEEPSFVSGQRLSITLKMPNTTMVRSEIQDVDWYLVEVNGKKPVPARKRPFIKFNSKDGFMSGHTGVNGFGGEYKLDKDSLRIIPGPMTMMAGTPEQMEIESALTQMLSLVTRYQIKNGELQLLQNNRTLARFSAK